MKYDEGLAQRIRELLEEHDGLEEKVMFGGIGFLLRGNMAVGINKEDLIVRVGQEEHVKALKQPHARVFDMTGKPMKGWILVAPKGYEEDKDLKRWVKMGADFAMSLPPK